MDKFEPVSGGGEMDHAQEAVGQLVVAGGDGTVDLEMAEHALDRVFMMTLQCRFLLSCFEDLRARCVGFRP